MFFTKSIVKVNLFYVLPIAHCYIKLHFSLHCWLFKRSFYLNINVHRDVFLVPSKLFENIVYSFLFFYVLVYFFFLQMKSTTVLYRYNDISRKNGFYSLNIRHAAITGAIYTLVSANIYLVMGFYANKDLYQNVVGTFLWQRLGVQPI